MPKIILAIGAVAVIAFSIGYNTAKYPIVWEMVGPSAHLPDVSGIDQSPTGADQAPGVKPAVASQSTKSAEPVASIPNNNPAPTPSSDLPATDTVQSQPAETDLADAQLPTSPITQQALLVRSESSGAESTLPMGNLVPVPSSLFTGNGMQPVEQYNTVRRLPPVYQAAPIPAGRYAAEYPQSPIPIYPSTGSE